MGHTKRNRKRSNLTSGANKKHTDLSELWLVKLIVTVSTIAHKIYDYVAHKLLAILGSKLYKDESTIVEESSRVTLNLESQPGS